MNKNYKESSVDIGINSIDKDVDSVDKEPVVEADKKIKSITEEAPQPLFPGEPNHPNQAFFYRQQGLFVHVMAGFGVLVSVASGPLRYIAFTL